MSQIHIVRRYTDLSSLIDILVNKRITLLDPKSWDDKNDAYCMASYKEKNSLKSLLALCFTTSGETYHHWKVFAGSNNGVCILFKYTELRSILDKETGLSYQLVNYPKQKKIQDCYTENIIKLPFIKRYAFRDEKEFRIIRETESELQDSYSIQIPIYTIARVVINPWVHQNLVVSIRKMINLIPDCEKLEVSKSTLIDSQVWQKFANRVAGSD